MSKHFEVSEIKAALRAAFTAEFSVVESNFLMPSDFWFKTKSGIKVVPFKGDNFTEGATYHINLFGAKFNTFVHYSYFTAMNAALEEKVDFFEIYVEGNKLLKVITYCYGMAWTKYVDIGLS